MAKDSLARGAKSASFGHAAAKDEPIEFHGTVATETAEVDKFAAKQFAEMREEVDHEAFISQCIPLNSMVLIRPIKEAEGAIIQPERYQRNTNKGMVLAVGPDVARPSVGNVVLYNEYSNQPLTLDGEDLILIDARDIQIKLPR